MAPDQPARRDAARHGGKYERLPQGFRHGLSLQALEQRRERQRQGDHRTDEVAREIGEASDPRQLGRSHRLHAPDRPSGARRDQDDEKRQDEWRHRQSGNGHRPRDSGKKPAATAPGPDAERYADERRDRERRKREGRRVRLALGDQAANRTAISPRDTQIQPGGSRDPVEVLGRHGTIQAEAGALSRDDLGAGTLGDELGRRVTWHEPDQEQRSRSYDEHQQAGGQDAPPDIGRQGTWAHPPLLAVKGLHSLTAYGAGAVSVTARRSAFQRICGEMRDGRTLRSLGFTARITRGAAK